MGNKVGIMNIKPIRSTGDYEEALRALELLVAADPDPDSEDGDRLNVLTTLIESYENDHYPSTLPSPIEAIKFRMEQANLSPIDLVPFIGSRSKVSEILSGKRSLSLEMIRALELGLGIPAKVLIQKPEAGGQYQTWSDTLVKAMDKLGYFGTSSYDGKNKEPLLSKFFGGATNPTLQFAWRKTDQRISPRTDEHALTAWATYIEYKASSVITKDYKDGTITLDYMKEVLKLSVHDDGPLRAQKMLKDDGIVLVVAAHLPKTRVDGVTILKDKNRPIIGLSLRFDRIDNFWFTLLHELAHISRHLNNDSVFFDELEDGLGIDINEIESEADSLAQEAIIPSAKWEISPAKIIPSPMAAQSLANELGIHVAVIAGYIRYKHQNYFYLKKIVSDTNTGVRHLFNGQFA
ncbi:ImmA/IrrE family metallo-endopeptidase [Candidatus Saccharibacteria bacterium]|nr:ImmA/IrrE family metallo-endopeptidase [Candidatus Saccharibacteria bacterium]NCU40705.1 ImmA/IrrE family metallo-endopeptidase [Candidatus Saccharibacteria bacterium]